MGTAGCHRLDHATYADLVASEVADFAETVRRADLDAKVPTCPDWTIADLVEHTAQVHHWCERIVRERSPGRVPFNAIEFNQPSEAREYPTWLNDFGPSLAATLREADPAQELWAWGDDKHARFWPRRMLHETTVHHADASIAVGKEPKIADRVAGDGIDEFLDNLPHAKYFAPNVDKLRGAGERVVFEAADTGVRWFVTLEPEQFSWSHDGVDADVRCRARPRICTCSRGEEFVPMRSRWQAIARCSSDG